MLSFHTMLSPILQVTNAPAFPSHIWQLLDYSNTYWCPEQEPTGEPTQPSSCRRKPTALPARLSGAQSELNLHTLCCATGTVTPLWGCPTQHTILWQKQKQHQRSKARQTERERMFP